MTAAAHLPSPPHPAPGLRSSAPSCVWASVGAVTDLGGTRVLPRNHLPPIEEEADVYTLAERGNVPSQGPPAAAGGGGLVWEPRASPAASLGTWGGFCSLPSPSPSLWEEWLLPGSAQVSLLQCPWLPADTAGPACQDREAQASGSGGGTEGGRSEGRAGSQCKHGTSVIPRHCPLLGDPVWMWAGWEQPPEVVPRPRGSP